MTEQERPISDTRFKLEEASYFFEQMKKNLDNRKYFTFNLIAFVVAGRSVTFVMQSEFTKVGPFAKWYCKNVDEALRKEEVPRFFRDLRNIVLKEEGNPRQYLRTVVTRDYAFSYDILGPATENEEGQEEGLMERNSERESQQQVKETTIIEKPAAPDPTLKYLWDIPDINDKTKKSTRYVIESCEQYLQRLSGLVDECERLFGQRQHSL
jgi:hypothetical protein